MIDAVHTTAPKADLYTGKIAEHVAQATGYPAIIATISRALADLNAPMMEQIQGMAAIFIAYKLSSPTGFAEIIGEK